MDDATWAALALVLTVVGAAWTWYAFRRRGPASGLRGTGLTLLPAAAYLTDTLEMATRIATAVADWAAGLVLSPPVWTGIALAAVAAVLVLASRVVGNRERAGGRRTTSPRGTGRHAVGEGGGARGEPAIGGDDEMAEIEALLRRRGIS